MPRLRIALAQVNPTVGDLDGNAAAILDWTRRAADRGAHLVAFPEMVLTGYPVEDLALRASFVDARRGAAPRGRGWRPTGSAARGRRRLPRPGTPAPPPRYGRAGRGRRRTRRRCCTAAGSLARYAKHHLPNYGVFDEYRYFVPGDRLPCPPPVRGARVGRAASTWRSPSARTCGRTAARSPSPGRPAPGCWSCSTGRRTSATRTTSGWSCARAGPARPGATLAYVNMVGGQDELVFDGDSIVVDAAAGCSPAGRSSTRRWSS